MTATTEYTSPVPEMCDMANLRWQKIYGEGRRTLSPNGLMEFGQLEIPVPSVCLKPRMKGTAERNRDRLVITGSPGDY